MLSVVSLLTAAVVWWWLVVLCGGDQQREALVEFYASTNGASWKTACADKWNTTNATCEWHGVKCNNSSLSMVKLILEECNLSGTLPGTLGASTSLTDISLNFNNISGTIPLVEWAGYGLNQSLTVIAMSSNAFYGDLTGLDAFTKLDYLELTNMRTLNGTLPALMGTALSTIKWIRLQSNSLRGPISPTFASTRLVDFSLHSNSFSSSLPSVISSASITNMDLSSNRFQGTIPSTGWNLGTALTFVSLADNRLTGTVPVMLTSLSTASKNISYNCLVLSSCCASGWCSGCTTQHVDTAQCTTLSPSPTMASTVSWSSISARFSFSETVSAPHSGSESATIAFSTSSTESASDTPSPSGDPHSPSPTESYRLTTSPGALSASPSNSPSNAVSHSVTQSWVQSASVASLSASVSDAPSCSVRTVSVDGTATIPTHSVTTWRSGSASLSHLSSSASASAARSPSLTWTRSETLSVSGTIEATATCSVTTSKENVSNTRLPSRTLASASLSHTHRATSSMVLSITAGSPTHTSSLAPTASVTRSLSGSFEAASATITVSTSTSATKVRSMSRETSSASTTASRSISLSLPGATITGDRSASGYPSASRSATHSDSPSLHTGTLSFSRSVIVVRLFQMDLTQNVATSASAVAAYSVVAIGGSAAGSAASVQVLLMQVSACLSRDRDATLSDYQIARERTGGRSAYSLSPFWDFGFLIAAYANIAVMVVFAWVQGGIVLLRSDARQDREVLRAIDASYGTKTRDDVEEDEELHRRKCKGILREWRWATVETAGRWRFPGIAIRVAEMLLPGTMFCAVGFLLTADENTSGFPAGAAIAFIIAVVAAWLGYLHVRIVPCLRFTPSHHLMLYPDAVSPHRNRRWITRLIPTHRWEPLVLRASFGILYDAFKERYVRYRVLEVGLTVSIAGMSALGAYGKGLACVVACGWMALCLVIAAVMTATHDVYRLPLDRVFVPVKHLVFGAMCCIKTVGLDVPGPLTVAQLGLILLRVLYGFWVAYEERVMTSIEQELAHAADYRADEWSSIASSAGVAVGGEGTVDQTTLELELESLDEEKVGRQKRLPPPPPPPPPRLRKEKDLKMEVHTTGAAAEADWDML